MRITNAMIMNNSLSNISTNKKNVDRLNTQMSTEKKIQKPSEDPVVAIRALRLRSQLAELNQYLEKNVPDASSWLQVTEEALSGVSKMLTGMNTYLVQGASDGLTAEDRKTIIENLRQFREQIFQDANADYAGRTVFTGYKTDKNMTFKTDENVTYTITENITKDSFDYVTKIEGLVEDGTISSVAVEDMPEPYDVYRVRLAYEGLDAGTTVALNEKDGTTPLVAEANIITVYQDSNGNYVYEPQDGSTYTPEPGTGIYQPRDGEVFYLADSGELVFGKDAYATVNNYVKANGEIKFTYNKTGFEKGDLLPEHYFDTVRTEGDGVTTSIYTSKPQDIEYTVNFNQKLKVNTEGKNVFNHKMVRDLDELIEKVEATLAAETKIKNIENMMKEAIYSDETSQANLKSMLEAAKKEFDLADDIMQKTFELSITDYQDHQERIDLEIADIGSRDKRLQLNKERLTSQQENFEELKSQNEDANMADTIIKYSAAEVVYDASLLAAGKVVTKSLLDFI